jgi:hypothetical protein
MDDDSRRPTNNKDCCGSGGRNEKTENDVLEHILINMPKDYNNNNNDLYTMYHLKVGNPKDPLTLLKR